LKILCLNIRSGSGSRWGAILEFVDEQDPDVVVLTEWRRSTSPGRAEEWANTRGMQWSSACDGATRNGVAIASKVRFDCVSATPGQESAGTILRAAFFGWTMLACYFPQGEAKGRYFDVCRDVARACSGHPLLVLGDLNTGNQLADKTLGGVNYACADKFDRLSSTAGLIDLWRLTNGTHAREWTWRTPKNGFRIDHAFGNGEFLERYRPGGHYDHAPREARFSDHSALLVTMIETHSP
jgi:exonuclease III